MARLLLRLALATVLLGAARAAGCPSEPLRLLGPGQYAEVLNGLNTTCAAFAPGCPYAVPFPDFPCLVNCVASSADCVRMNRRTPSVSPGDAHSCTTCSISACEACVYGANGEARCARCFDGFDGQGGEPGRWESCDLRHVGLVLAVSEVLAGIIVALLILAMVTTCIGAWHKDLHSWVSVEPSHDDGLMSPLTNTLKQNREAIGKGLHLSLMSSIKYSCLRLYPDGPEAETSQRPSLRGLAGRDLDKQLVDVGLGIQLFFNTQRFFICMALVTWLAALAVGIISPGLPQDLLEGATCGEALHASLGVAEAQLGRARLQGVGCMVLWVVLLVITWAFHCYQMRFVESYDKGTHTAEDYTIKLEGLPKTVTSERELTRLLEEELRMEGLIHGVCICYNVLALPKPELIEEMVDRLVELDDLDLGLYEEHMSKPRGELLQELAGDAEQLKAWLADGTLHGSGTAYVVFQKQRDVARVMTQRRGIARRVFEREAASADGDSENGDAHEIQTVQITKDNCEPSGVRFEAFEQPRKQHRRNECLWMPLRMVVYISVYACAAHLFFLYMIKPWEDNFIVGAESDFGVKVGGKLVLLLNFGIQTLVMMDVERGGFLRTAEVDSITFVWNTVLLLVTNFYVIVQEVYRDGYRWILVPPEGCLNAKDHAPAQCWDWLRLLFQSVATEKAVGTNLVSVLTEQIMMLYVMGEVANVLMPVIVYWVALRLIFVMNVGGSTGSWFQRSLRAMLPESASATTITVREAEKAQMLMPLLLWMEYTYIVIFPAMALVTFYLVTDDTSSVCLWLLIFSVIHYGWQRFVMIWLYGKATYDSTESYEAFILMWGLVLSMLPPASIWWAFRRGEVQEPAFAMLSMALVFLLVLLVYRYSLLLLGWTFGARDDGIDDMVDGDPGYESIVNRYGISWWNRNPVYVLKNRHCPELPGHEVHERTTRCWPKNVLREGFFELGKEFRHFHSAAQRRLAESRTASLDVQDGGGRSLRPSPAWTAAAKGPPARPNGLPAAAAAPLIEEAPAAAAPAAEPPLADGLLATGGLGSRGPSFASLSSTVVGAKTEGQTAAGASTGGLGSLQVSAGVAGPSFASLSSAAVGARTAGRTAAGLAAGQRRRCGPGDTQQRRRRRQDRGADGGRRRRQRAGLAAGQRRRRESGQRGDRSPGCSTCG